RRAAAARLHGRLPPRRAAGRAHGVVARSRAVANTGTVDGRLRIALGLIVAAAVFRGVAWAVVLPPWQGPDEPGHYWYADELARGRLPSESDDGPSAALVRSVARAAFEDFRSRSPDRPFTASRRRALAEAPRE